MMIYEIFRNIPKVWVTLYTPPAEEENNSTKVLGVFKSKRKAYEKATAELIKDIENKYGEKKKGKEKAENAVKLINKNAEKDYEKRFEEATEQVTKAFGGKEDDAPYCEVNDSLYDQK